MADRADPLGLTLKFARAEQPDDPFAFRFAEQTYLIRGAGGGFRSARLSWDAALLDDLQRLKQPGCSPVLRQRVGILLRKFLPAGHWAEMEVLLRAAIDADRPVLLTIRSAAAEPAEDHSACIAPTEKHCGLLASTGPALAYRRKESNQGLVFRPDRSVRRQLAQLADNLPLFFSYSGSDSKR